MSTSAKQPDSQAVATAQPDHAPVESTGGRRRSDHHGRKRSRASVPRLLKRSKPGAVAGIDLDDLARMPSTAESVAISCIDYGPAQASAAEVKDLDKFLAAHRPEWAAVRWINVDGLTDMKVIRSLAEKYNLHPLAVEDVLHVTHRPKVEQYRDEGRYQARLFIIVRMLDMPNGHLRSEQISIFLGHHTVLTFQESPGDVWDALRQRLQVAGSRLRNNDAGFLLHSLLDAIVDSCFPLLEVYGDRLEDVEAAVLEQPTPAIIQEIHQLKRELLLLRRAVWPMREVIAGLQREPHDCLSDATRTYMRDIYDHTVQIIDIVETYREVATGLTETYMTAMSQRLNEVMKVLTIIGTIFIPLTFLAGVYGMNFKHFPEIEWIWGYPFFWTICAVTAVTMIVWFKRRQWF
ncbi:MAG TPA: magnesium/cobalt transporter CorA [Vicinamibacterales bacterium]|jgi:magnesium transporter